MVLGPSVGYDEENDRLVIDPSKYNDSGAFISRTDLSSEKTR
ncbi:hypothetical protein [Rossellomorea sp. NS-SX7]